ncbi:MAG TPA: SRPBCC family protein [Gaiellaceae bacterium]|nr:SRPBCC family protein [Gaiellaceae bacterium]
MSALGTIAPDGERRRIRFERHFDAPIAGVWSALTDPERLARWLAPASFADGAVRLEFDAENVVTGALLASDPPRLLEYEWRFPGETESVVRFELFEDGDATMLVLEHRLLGAGQAVGYGAGWHAHLDGLADELASTSGSWDERFAEWLPRYRALAAS